MGRVKSIALVCLFVLGCVLLLNCASNKRVGFRLQSLSPVWYGKENIRLFPLFFHAKGDGKITPLPYLIKTIDEGVEIIFLHPLNYVVDFPLMLISLVPAWTLEGPDVPFMEVWVSSDFGWVFLIINKDTFAVRLTPLLFLHIGSMFDSKYFQNLKFHYPPGEEALESSFRGCIISSFPLFHLSGWKERDKPDTVYENLSLLWFLYWHWKVAIRDTIYKRAHYLYFPIESSRKKGNAERHW